MPTFGNRGESPSTAMMVGLTRSRSTDIRASARRWRWPMRSPRISESERGPDPLREKRQQHREMAARPVALVALRFVPLPAKAGRAARQAARLGVLAGRPRRQGQEDGKAMGEEIQDDGCGLACRYRQSEAAGDPACAEAGDRANLAEISLP